MGAREGKHTPIVQNESAWKSKEVFYEIPSWTLTLGVKSLKELIAIFKESWLFKR
jgi:hypothetical protein